jgi:peptidoglycan/LPS O-acetylase OafA/YrhL
MYFLLPFLFFFLRRNFVLWPLLLLWIATAAYDRANFPPDNNTFAVCIPYFLSGVIAYLLYSKVKPRLPAFVLPLLVIVLLCIFMPWPSWRNGWWLTIALGLSLPFIRPLRTKWLIGASHHIAKYSYGIYLAHPFCIALGVNFLKGHSLSLQIAAIVLSMAGIVIPAYHFLEKPMIDLGAKFADWMEQRYESSSLLADR